MKAIHVLGGGVLAAACVLAGRVTHPGVAEAAGVAVTPPEQLLDALS